MKRCRLAAKRLPFALIYQRYSEKCKYIIYDVNSTEWQQNKTQTQQWTKDEITNGGARTHAHTISTLDKIKKKKINPYLKTSENKFGNDVRWCQCVIVCMYGSKNKYILSDEANTRYTTHFPFVRLFVCFQRLNKILVYRKIC